MSINSLLQNQFKSWLSPRFNDIRIDGELNLNGSTGVDGEVLSKLAGVPVWAPASGGGGFTSESVTITAVSSALSNSENISLITSNQASDFAIGSKIGFSGSYDKMVSNTDKIILYRNTERS
jgi:hypothetical protein